MIDLFEPGVSFLVKYMPNSLTALVHMLSLVIISPPWLLGTPFPLRLSTDKKLTFQDPNIRRGIMLPNHPAHNNDVNSLPIHPLLASDNVANFWPSQIIADLEY